MAPGANTSYLRVELLRATRAVARHAQTLGHLSRLSQPGARRPALRARDRRPGECRIQAFAGARPYRLSISQGEFTAAPDWYWNFWHREEARARSRCAGGFIDSRILHRGACALQQPVFLTATAERPTAAPGARSRRAHCRRAAQRLTAPLPKSAPAWIRTLARASDQFIVRRERRRAARAAAPASSRAIPGSPTGAATP